MAASPIPALPSVVSIAPRLEPHLVEVVVWYPFGASEEAVAAAAAKVAELLAQPDLGEALADTPDAEEDSPRVATAAMVQAVRRLVIEQAREIATDLAKGIAQAAIADLLTTPNKLRGLLPNEPPDTPSTPWWNNGGIAFTPDA